MALWKVPLKELTTLWPFSEPGNSSSDGLCTEMAKNLSYVVWSRLWPRGDFTQPRTHFLGQLCRMAVMRWSILAGMPGSSAYDFSSNMWATIISGQRTSDLICFGPKLEICHLIIMAVVCFLTKVWNVSRASWVDLVTRVTFPDSHKKTLICVERVAWTRPRGFL